jgi:hypothetical protein
MLDVGQQAIILGKWLVTGEGTRVHVVNTWLSAALRCVGLADLSMMPPWGSEHTVALTPINNSWGGAGRCQFC